MNKDLSTQRSPNSLLNFKDEIENFFDRFSKELTLGSEESNFLPRVEVKDNGKNFLVSAELPGMSEKDINLSLDNNTLIIEGERKSESKVDEKDYYRSEFSYGSFYRAIPLPSEINADKVDAKYENGVLKVTLDKVAESKSKTKKIEIGKGSGSKGLAH